VLTTAIIQPLSPIPFKYFPTLYSKKTIGLISHLRGGNHGLSVRDNYQLPRNSIENSTI